MAPSNKKFPPGENGRINCLGVGEVLLETGGDFQDGDTLSTRC